MVVGAGGWGVGGGESSEAPTHLRTYCTPGRGSFDLSPPRSPRPKILYLVPIEVGDGRGVGQGIHEHCNGDLNIRYVCRTKLY